MLDVYEQLAIMSKGLQSNSLIISDVRKYVVKTTRGLSKVSDNPGTKEAWLAEQCAKDGGANNLGTCALQVYDDIDEDLKRDRAYVITALKDQLHSRFKKVLDHPVLQAFAVFDHRHWPTEQQRLKDFGAAEINELYKHYEVFFNDTTKEAVLEQRIDLKNEINESPGLRKREFKSLWPAMLCALAVHMRVHVCSPLGGVHANHPSRHL